MFGGIYSVVRHSLYVRLERFMPSAQQEHARSSRSALQFACDVAGAALVRCVCVCVCVWCVCVCAPGRGAHGQ